MFSKNWKQQFKQDMIMEWYQVYINFVAIYDPLVTLSKIHQSHHKQIFINRSQQFIYTQLLPQQCTILQKSYNYINKLNNIGKYKSRLFCLYKKMEISLFCIQLLQILQQMSVFNVVTHRQCQQREQIKVVIKLIYVNVAYLRKFLQTNHRIYKEICRLMQFYALPFLDNQRDGNQDVQDLCEEEDLDQARFRHKKKKISMERTQHQDNIITLSQTEQSKGEFQLINQQLYDTIIPLPSIQITQQHWNQQKQLNFLTNIQQKMSEIYKKLVYFDRTKTHNLQSLAEIKQKQTSSKTYMLVGLYTGMTIVSIVAVCLLFVFDLLQPIKDTNRIDSLYFIIPMFRGIGLFIFYLWGMAFNVFIFNKFRVSYRRILQYGHHYSTAFIIMKLAAFYTFIYIFMLVLYLIGASYNTDIADQHRFPVQYTPFVVWILFLGYIFFPNRQIFNPEGRKYFYKVLVSVVKSPCSRVNFLISWVTDQAVSFVIPFKDFGYTLCFFTQNFNNPKQVHDHCLDKTTPIGFFIAYFIAIIPLLFRMIQCYRQAKQDTGIFIGHTQMWNFGKYCIAMITSTLSFLFALQKDNKDQPSYLILQVLFICSSICSTFYAYYWDLKYDWGFLQKSARHKFLRNHLNYQNNKIYYLAIIFNLLFRFGWTISLSLVLHNTDFQQVDIVLMALGMVQITRRCIWNFFRIQKEHIIYCKNYAATRDIFKQIQIIKAINQGNVENIANLPVNLEYQAIPYFFNSQQQIFKIQILDQEFIRNFDQNKITQYKNKFEKLIDEEQKQRKEYSS